jgi:ATP-binding cassette, subfamily B, bacterial
MKNIIEDSSSIKEFPKTTREFIKYFFAPYRTYFIVLFFIILIVSLYSTVQPYVLKRIIDIATPLLGQKGLVNATLFPVLILITLTILNNIAWRLNNYVILKSVPKLKSDIISQTSDYVHGHSFKFFQDNLSGATSNRITDLANNADNLITTVRELLVRLLILISAIFIAALVNPLFFFVFLIWTLSVMGLATYFNKKIEPLSNIFAGARSHVIGNVVDSFANAINVILFSGRKFENKYLKTSLDDMVKKDVTLQEKLMKYATVMSVMTILIEIFTIFPLIFLASKGALTVGDFALIFILSHNIIEQVWSITEVYFRASQQLGVFNQAIKFLSQKPDIVDASNVTPLKIKNGAVVFSAVNFYYTESQRLFEDKTLIIKGGEKVGLVGYSGSGKSTFVNLITRMFDVQKGDILIDDQSIRSISLESLRKNISFIPQDPTLFHRSIMDNIRYGKFDASDEEVIEAAKIAHVHEFVTQLPSGYQTFVGERGVKLSGGQRQRVAIARAILKDAPILILDEATSALDSFTESLIQESLQIAMKNKTVIVIAHRLSTIKNLDRILVFDKGHVVEEGAHEFLLANGIIYPQLWNLQQGFLAY